MLKKLVRLACALCAFVVLLTCVPAFAADNDIANLEITGTINCSKLKLRATPSAEARTLGTYDEGTRVTVIRQDETWCQVMLDDKTGYMMTKYLDIDVPYVSQGYAVTPADKMLLHLYEEPNASSPVRYQFQGGACFEIIKDLGEFCQVRSGSVMGYIESNYLTRTEEPFQVFTHLGENNPYAVNFNTLGKVQDLGSGKGMNISRGAYSSSVMYPVLALGVADAVISSQVRAWQTACEEAYKAYHDGKTAQFTVDYSAHKLDDNYGYLLLGATFEVENLNTLTFAQPMLIDLVTGDVVNGSDIFVPTDRITFQLEVALDAVFDGYVEEYANGITDSLLSRAVLAPDGVKFFFNAGEILPLHLGAQCITLPYYRTYEYIALDSRFIDNNTRKIDPTKPMIALTFDDGPSEETLRIVSELEKYNSRGTFCVVGSRLEEFEEVLRETAASGQEIANHTWSHRNLEESSSDTVRSQIGKVNDLVYEMTGVTIRVLRPPYGANDKKVRNICAEMDMYLAHWKLDTLDWVSRNTSSVYKKIVREVENGAIILCHDLYDTTADAVIQAIPELISKGYQLVTVTEMLSFHKDGITPGTTYSRIDPANVDTSKGIQ